MFVQPDHFTERHFRWSKLSKAGGQQHGIAIPDLGERDQQVEVAHRPQCCLRIGMAAQPGALERDRRKPCSFEQPSAFDQLAPRQHRLQRRRAVGFAPVSASCERNHRVGPMLGVEQRLQAVLAGQIGQHGPVALIQTAQIRHLPVPDQGQQNAPQRRKVHAPCPISWCAWAQKRCR